MQLYNRVSFETSKLVTKTYSTSFSAAVSFLEKDIETAIYSIYGFVRLADEIVDSFHEVNQKALFDQFEKDYSLALERGVSINPILHSFALTVRKYNIPLHLIEAFLKSMKADLNKQVYATNSELDEYIYGSADVVGLMCLMVFVNGDHEQYEKLKKPAMKLGTAFQKVNFLRDLKEDIQELTRSYFPELKDTNLDEATKTKLIEDIESDFREAKLGIHALPGRTKLAVDIAYEYYMQLLKKLKQTPANKIMQTRIRVPDPIKFLLLTKTYIKYQLNIKK